MLIEALPELIALDLETTGLHPHLSEIVEIGAVRFRPETGEVLDRFQTLVNPGTPIPANVQAIHGITDEMVIDAPRVGDAYSALEGFVGTHPLVIGHNISFDLGFLQFRSRLLGRPLQFLRCIDTVHLARWAFPGLASYKLVNLRTALALPEDSAHRALDDAIAAATLFARGYRQLMQTGQSAEQFWQRLSKPLPESRLQPPPLSDDLQQLYRHCELGTRLFLIYRNANSEYSLRVVDPEGMSMQHAAHVLVGYCHLKQAQRHFRHDRIIHWERADDQELSTLLPLQQVVDALPDPLASEQGAKSHLLATILYQRTSQPQA